MPQPGEASGQRRDQRDSNPTLWSSGSQQGKRGKTQAPAAWQELEPATGGPRRGGQARTGKQREERSRSYAYRPVGTYLYHIWKLKGKGPCNLENSLTLHSTIRASLKNFRTNQFPVRYLGHGSFLWYLQTGINQHVRLKSCIKNMRVCSNILQNRKVKLFISVYLQNAKHS